MASTGTGQTIATDLQQPPVIQVTSSRRWADLGLVVLIGFAPLVVGGIYQWFLPTFGNSRYTNLRFVNGLAQMTGVLTLCFTLLKRQGRSLKDIGLRPNWLDLPKGIGLYALSYFAFLAANATLQLLHFWWTRSYFELRDPKEIFVGAWPPLFLCYAVAAPIFEETLVRGYLMTELIGLSCPVWVAITASVVLQGSYHLYYGLTGAALVSTGFLVSAIYFVISRRLLPLIISHLFWDLTAIHLNWHR